LDDQADDVVASEPPAIQEPSKSAESASRQGDFGAYLDQLASDSGSAEEQDSSAKSDSSVSPESDMASARLSGGASSFFHEDGSSGSTELFRDNSGARAESLLASGFNPLEVEENEDIDLTVTPDDMRRYRAEVDKALRTLIVPAVSAAAEQRYPRQTQLARDLSQSADLRSPVMWFPLARRMKRKIIVHAGPTNSGKTYTALQRLRQARSGMYCGPLRLLALEVYDELNEDGVPTNLVTGQERRPQPFANHAACTVEMVDLDTPVDVAVIDEMQMIADPDRGWAWTRALLGLQAAEIHLAGDPAATSMVRKLVEQCGDDFELRTYDRLSALHREPRSLNGSLANVRAGDCIVAFSRKDIYAIRDEIERQTNHKCCVIYGSLPPEARSQQARLFNDESSGYDVLVASDAIGMGLNLNIRRVVFYTVDKYDGRRVGRAPIALVKQIAGRAGRKSSKWPEGYYTCFRQDHMQYVADCMATATPEISRAGVFPSAAQVQLFARHVPPEAHADLGQLLQVFLEASRLDDEY